jgi:hypothetical protein
MHTEGDGRRGYTIDPLARLKKFVNKNAGTGVL